MKSWVHESLNQNIPEDVKAFNFNLFELSTNYFGVELIGSTYFDRNDSDWACNEIWEPKQRSILGPEEPIFKKWQHFLEEVKNVITPLVQEEMRKNGRKRILAVGIGFVDGDLDIIYERGECKKFDG